MKPLVFFVTKAAISGVIVAVVSSVAKRDNLLASIIHSLPLLSLLAFTWMFVETRDTALIARHAQGTFWFVLPTLPMFVLLPWLLRRGVGFWPSLALCIFVTVALYFLSMRLLKAAAIEIDTL